MLKSALDFCTLLHFTCALQKSANDFYSVHKSITVLNLNCSEIISHIYSCEYKTEYIHKIRNLFVI